MQHKNFNSLQGLRCFAALLVCGMHLFATKPPTDDFIAITQKLGNSIGRYGVDLFFVISGFIITWIVMKEDNLPSIKAAIGFLIKRCFRIYPLYWVTLAVMLFLSICIHGVANNNEITQVLSYRVWLLWTYFIPLQAVAWTLPFELYFYAIVFVFMCICGKKVFLPFFFVWTLIHFILLCGYSLGIVHMNCFILMNNQLLEFSFGLFVGYLLHKYNHETVYDKYACIVLGVILLIIGTVISYIRLPRMDLGGWEIIYFHGIPGALFVYGLIGLELQNKLYTPKIFKQLGDISYSIYLWHFPMLGFTTLLMIHFPTYQDIHPVIRAILEMIVVIMISFASYRWIERPCIRFSRHLANKIQ